MEGCTLKEPVFKGSCTAMITPFGENGIDNARLKRQLELQAESNTAAIVVAGTTGEIATLTESEYLGLAEFCIRESSGRMKVILGVGGNDTEHCLRNARSAKRIGADAILMTPPYYNKTSKNGLAEHFLYVADRVSIPMILYNVPGRTAIGIPAEVYRRLAEHPNINGVKEASGDFSLIAWITSELSGRMWLWSGNDDHTIPMMSLGALGVISVASNIVPDAVYQICEQCLSGDFRSANAVFGRFAALFRALFAETNPIPVKAAMQLLGTDSGILRRPLVSISQENLALLKREMEQVGLLC